MPFTGRAHVAQEKSCAGRWAGVPDTGAQDAANDRLEVPHVLGGRLLIALADPADEIVKRGVWRHRSIPLTSSRPGLPAARSRATTSAGFLEFSVRPPADCIEESGRLSLPVARQRERPSKPLAQPQLAGHRRFRAASERIQSKAGRYPVKHLSKPVGGETVRRPAGGDFAALGSYNVLR